MIRVAHVITRLCKGGAQENTFHTVRLANKDRFAVDLISGPTFGTEGSIEDAVRNAGIDFIREPNLVRPVCPLRDWRAYRGLTRLFRERNYHIVHTHTSKAGFIGRLAAARAGVPVIVHTPHGHIFHGYFGTLPTRGFIYMERWAARKTDRIITLTQQGAEDHLAHCIGRPAQYVPIFSGIDPAPFIEARARRETTRATLGIPADAVLIGAVGRLEPVKGFSYFVEAAHQVARDCPAARFVLTGDGSLRDALAAQAAPLGQRFHMLGMREDVPALMAAFDIFVLPSVNEGMGRVLLEAGAAATPAVASRVGGVADIVGDGQTGILVPPCDVAALADTITTLAEDPERRRVLGEAARAKVVPDFGLDRMIARIEALYEELIKEKNLDA